LWSTVFPVPLIRLFECTLRLSARNMDGNDCDTDDCDDCADARGSCRCLAVEVSPRGCTLSSWLLCVEPVEGVGDFGLDRLLCFVDFTISPPSALARLREESKTPRLVGTFALSQACLCLRSAFLYSRSDDCVCCSLIDLFDWSRRASHVRGLNVQFRSSKHFCRWCHSLFFAASAYNLWEHDGFLTFTFLFPASTLSMY
jgi:hypothetical protein